MFPTETGDCGNLGTDLTFKRIIPLLIICFDLNAREKDSPTSLSWNINVTVLGLGEFKQPMQPFTW